MPYIRLISRYLFKVYFGCFACLFSWHIYGTRGVCFLRHCAYEVWAARNNRNQRQYQYLIDNYVSYDTIRYSPYSGRLLLQKRFANRSECCINLNWLKAISTLKHTHTQRTYLCKLIRDCDWVCACTEREGGGERLRERIAANEAFPERTIKRA